MLLVLAAPENPSMRAAKREAAESAKAGRKGFNNGWSKTLRWAEFSTQRRQLFAAVMGQEAALSPLQKGTEERERQQGRIPGSGKRAPAHLSTRLQPTPFGVRTQHTLSSKIRAVLLLLITVVE